MTSSRASLAAKLLLILATAAMCSSCTPARLPAIARRPLFHFLHRESCDGPPLSRTIGRLNNASLYVLHFAPFGRPEQGWATYAPAIEGEIGTQCAADSGGFAGALARWQHAHKLPATGVMTIPTFDAIKLDLQERRPFVALRTAGVCPEPPGAGRLTEAKADESYQGKAVLLRTSALSAYRRMVADARRAEPRIAANPQLLAIFSAFRSPAYDAARCARDNNCQGVVRAACSAHRTGLAVDLVLETAQGYPVDSSADPNRLAMANGVAYRWLVANARRYGFVNYPFEPWHWEWTGEKP